MEATDAAIPDWLFSPTGGARLTRDIPGVGGRIKQRPEDFVVEEIPAYEPAGAGEHLYLLIEKRNLATTQAIGIVARRFGVRRSAVGYAGMKDKRAVTRQWLSVQLPGHNASTPTEVHDDRLTTLRSAWHANKLRVGHLAGNCFEITIRECDQARAADARRILESLAQTGFANRSGEQRFGSTGRNHLLGRADLLRDATGTLDLLLGPTDDPDRGDEPARQAYARGDYTQAMERFPGTARTERRVLSALIAGADAPRACAEIDTTQRRFWVNAFQSALFNRVLDQRIEEGLLATLLEGDLAFKHRNGAVFAVDGHALADPDTRRRLEALEISPSGPIWGSAMTEASGDVGALERRVLDESGVTIEDFVRFEQRTRQPVAGVRRALRETLMDPDVDSGQDEAGPFIRCRFTLPRGAFATEIMREVMGGPTEDSDEEERDG